MQTEKGTFAQIPVVFLDTCDLPEAQQMLFLRLYRETYNGTTPWKGSIRKLAKIGRVSTGTAFNAIRKLAAAGLFSITELANEKNNADSMIIHLKGNELWRLNIYYCAGNPVEKWKVFPSHLIDGVHYLNTSSDTCSNNERGGVQIMNTSQAQGCSNNERGVFNSQAQSGDIDSYVDIIDNTSSRKKDGANASSPTSQQNKNNKIVSIDSKLRNNKRQEPLIELTSDEQAVYDLYCTLFHVITNKPSISEKVKGQCAILAPHIKTQEDIVSIDKYSRNHTKGHPQKMHLGNLVTNLDGWILEVKQASNKPAQDEQQSAPVPSQDMPVRFNSVREKLDARDQNELVFWTTTGKRSNRDPLTWQLMPLHEAREIGYREDINRITRRDLEAARVELEKKQAQAVQA